MEQSRLKLRISRMFRSSFGSCRSRKPSDVIEKAFFTSQPPLMTSPKPQLFPSSTTLNRPKICLSSPVFYSRKTQKTRPLPLTSSSSEDDETETLFSSKALSSDSSGPRRRNREVGIEECVGRSVEESFAVVKRSSDPYGDFRASMVEMIVEKQMFGAEELEDLLRCFLSLNSRQHHGIIVRVFTEIWEALFCTWS